MNLSWGRVMESIGLACALALTLGPLLALISEAGQETARGHLEWLLLALPDRQKGWLFLKSLAFSAAVAISALLLGWTGAALLWMRSSRWGPRLVWAAVVLAALPPYLHALAWMAVSAGAGKLASEAGIWLGPPNGWASAGWVQCAAYLPVAYGCAWTGLRALDPDLVDAARLGRSDPAVLLYCVLPLCGPALITGSSIIFLFSLLDFSIPSLFQVHVYAMEVFVEFAASGSPARALWTAAPLLAISIPMLVGFLKPLRALRLVNRPQQNPWANPARIPAGAFRLLKLGGGLAALQAGAPFAVMLLLSRQPSETAGEISRAGGDILYSVGVALSAGLLALLPGMALARVIFTRQRHAGACWFLALLPLAVPGALTGIGLVYLRDRVAGIESFLPVLAGLARFLPLATLLAFVQLSLADPLLFEAAALLSPSRWRRIVSIELPLLAPGLLAGLGLVSAFTIGELGATLMVVPPGQSTLVLRIYNYLHYGASQSVAGLCLALALVVLIASGLAVAAGAAWSRMAAPPEGRP